MYLDFLDAVWTRPGWGEFRMIRNGEVKRVWHEVGKPLPDGLLMGLAEAKWDVYYGVLPRTRAGGGKTEDIEPWTHILWADIDIKQVGSRMAAYLAITHIRVPEPHFVIDSGNGFHCYWRIDNTDWDTAEEAMRAIAKAIHGDHVYDRARILRVPGTFNWKSDPPKPVRILKYDTYSRPFSLTAFDQLRERPVQRYLADPRSVFTDLDDRLPQWLDDLIDHGVERGQRSEAAYRVVCNLLERGWSDGAIEDVFVAHPNGIGAKYHEKGADGPRWLATTIKSARQATAM